MKKVLLTAVVSALLVASCSQEEVVENVSNPQLKTRSAESEVIVIKMMYREKNITSVILS